MSDTETTWTLPRAEYMRLRLRLAGWMMAGIFANNDAWDATTTKLAEVALGATDRLLEQSGARIAEEDAS